MDKKKKKNALIRKFQKEILFWEIESDSDDKKSRSCNDFGTRSCLTCGKCWGKKKY